MGDKPPKKTQVGTCRQSMSLLDSSIFETSDAQKLVKYIRQKRGINNAQRIFNNSPVNEVVDRSFPIEIEPTQEERIPLKHSAKEDNHLPTCSNSRIPRINLWRKSVQRESFGKRVLLKEFEKTSADEGTFQPAAYSTPNSVVTNGDPNISGISRITAICHQEKGISQTQEPNVEENGFNVDYFEPIANNNDNQVIPDAAIHCSVDLPADVTEHEETIKNNTQPNLDDKVHEKNDNLTLINKKGGSKEGYGSKVHAERNASVVCSNEVLNSPIAHDFLYESQNKANSPKGKSSLPRSKRTHSLTVQSPNGPILSPRVLSDGSESLAAVQQDVSEKLSDSDLCSESTDDSENLKENENPKNKYTGKTYIRTERNTGRIKSPNCFSNSSSRIPPKEYVKLNAQKAVSKRLSHSMLNPGIELEDDCNKENEIYKSESIGRISSFSRSSRFKRSLRISSSPEQIEQVGQHVALGGPSNSDSSTEDDENQVFEEDCYDFKENNNSKKKSTDKNKSSNIKLYSIKSKVKSPNGPARSVEKIALDWNSNSEEDYENRNPERCRGRTSSRIDPSSRRSKAKPRNRLLRKVSISSNKERNADQQIALEDSSDSKEDYKEKKIPEKSPRRNCDRIEGNRKSNVRSKGGCKEEREAKKSEFRKEDNDTLKRINKQLLKKPLVYIPIIQNFHKKTECESGKSDNEKIAASGCEILTNKPLTRKDVGCQIESEIITSDEDESENSTHQISPQGKHKAKTKSEHQLLGQSYNNSNNPIDLRIRRTNEEMKPTRGRPRKRNNESRTNEEKKPTRGRPRKRNNENKGVHQLRSTEVVHPSDQLIDEISRPNEQKKRTRGRPRKINNENKGVHQLRSKEVVHSSDQLIDEIMLPLGKGVTQRKSSVTDCDIYTEEEEEEEVTNNRARSTVQEERIDISRTNSCGVETGALRCSLESPSSNNAGNFNDKIMDVKLLQNREIEELPINSDWKNAMDKVSQRFNEQNIPVVRKGKKRLSQMEKMDPIKRNYLDISKKLKTKQLDNFNISRRKLYSKGDSDNEISQLPDISARSSQETPVIAHSKEETRKALNFSTNSRNVKISNNTERLESIDSCFSDITASTAEPLNKNDNVFKIPPNPAPKTPKKKTGKKKHQKSIPTESINNVMQESNPVISVEENNQCRLTPGCNSANPPVEPDEIGDHRTETVAISRTSVDENSNNRVNKDLEERRQKRLSDIAENTRSRENSIVKTDQTKVKNGVKTSKKKKKEIELPKQKSKPTTSTHSTEDEPTDCLRRSSRQRKSPIVYWSCRLQLYEPRQEEVKRTIPVEKNKKNKNKESKIETKSSSKAKSTDIHSKKKLKDKNKETLENKDVQELKNTVPQTNVVSKDTEDRIAIDESHIAYELFDRLKESFSTEKSQKKRKNPKTCEENAMNKIIKLSEKPPTKVPESSEKPSEVVNQQEIAPISSDDGISTSEENHQPQPPWCMASLRTPTTDSGIQTGITSDTHVSKEDRLFSWLKSLSTPRTLTSNKDIVQILHSNTIKIANVEDLMFQEIDGVEYAYYLGEDNNYGYMKFHPQSLKPYARAKKVALKFLSLVGSLQMQIDKTPYTIKNGDLVTVPKGVRYGIANTTNDPAILFFIRTT